MPASHNCSLNLTIGGDLMDKDNYIEGIRSAWLGEQFGRAFFLEMKKATDDAAWQDKWQTLAQLEEMTGQRMADLLASHGESATTDIPVEVSPEIMEQYIGVPMQDVMTQFKVRVEQALLRFDHLLAVAPDEDIPAVQFLVDHELALLDFVDAELTGRQGESLDHVNRLLG